MTIALVNSYAGPTHSNITGMNTSGVPMTLTEGQFVVGVASFKITGTTGLTAAAAYYYDGSWHESTAYKTDQLAEDNFRFRAFVQKIPTTYVDSAMIGWNFDTALDWNEYGALVALTLTGVIDGETPLGPAVSDFVEVGVGGGVASLDITTPTNNCAIFTMCFGGTADPVKPTGYTDIAATNYITPTHAAFLADSGSAGVKTINWTVDSIGSYPIFAMAIKPAAGGGGGGGLVRLVGPRSRLVGKGGGLVSPAP